jgi:hypothetical protein
MFEQEERRRGESQVTKLQNQLNDANRRFNKRVKDAGDDVQAARLAYNSYMEEQGRVTRGLESEKRLRACNTKAIADGCRINWAHDCLKQAGLPEPSPQRPPGRPGPPIKGIPEGCGETLLYLMDIRAQVEQHPSAHVPGWDRLRPGEDRIRDRPKYATCWCLKEEALKLVDSADRVVTDTCPSASNSKALLTARADAQIQKRVAAVYELIDAIGKCVDTITRAYAPYDQAGR